MAEVYGVVDKVSYKEMNGRNGPYKVWNVCVNGDWYGHGTKQPAFGQGGEIEFDIAWNGDYANINMDTLNIISAGNVRSSGGGNGGNRGGNGGYNKPSGQQRGGGSRPNGSGNSRGNSGSSGNSAGAGKDKYWEDKEKRDKVKDVVVTHMACRNSAIEAVGMLLTACAVSLPTKKAEQMDAILELVDVVTERFLTGTREFTRSSLTATAAKTAKPAAPVRQPEPEPEPEPGPEPEQEEGEPQDFDDNMPF